MYKVLKEMLNQNNIFGEINSIFKEKNKDIYYIVIDNKEFLNPIYKIDLIKKEISESGINLIDLLNNYEQL